MVSVARLVLLLVWAGLTFESVVKFGTRLFLDQRQKVLGAVDFDFSFGDFAVKSVSTVPGQLDYLEPSNSMKFIVEFELRSKLSIERLDYFETIRVGAAKIYRRLPSALVSYQADSTASTGLRTVIIIALLVMAEVWLLKSILALLLIFLAKSTGKSTSHPDLRVCRQMKLRSGWGRFCGARQGVFSTSSRLSLPDLGALLRLHQPTATFRVAEDETL